MSRNDKRAANFTGPVTSSSAAKSESRKQAALLAKAQQRKERRNRTLLMTLAGVLVAALVVGGTIFALSRDSTGGATPPQVTADGGFVVGNAAAPVTVQVVEDFQCPVCKQFETTSGDLLDQYAAGSDVKVEYRGIAFLDRSSTTGYSTRALNTSACVMGQGTDVWKEFHRQMYLQQPAEGSAGLPNSELIAIAAAAGADEAAVSSCVNDATYEDWTKSTTTRAFDNGVSGTPTLFVNGTKVDGFSAAALQAAVTAAQAS
jgi:protein-disulfide isomerase